MKRLLALAMALCGLALCSSAQDWPQWRGQQRDGKVAGFVAPEKWPEKLTKKWESPIGRGDSCSALVGDKIYAFGRFGADEALTCLNLADGKQLWQTKYPADFTPTGPQTNHPGPRSSPLVADGKIYTLGVGGIVTCFNAANGDKIWQKASKAEFLDVDYKYDTGMSPMLLDGKLIVGIGNNAGKKSGALFAFDAATGEVKWKSEGEAPFYSSPIAMTVDGEKIIVAFTENCLNFYSPTDGKILWKKTFGKFTHQTPIIDGSTLYYGGPDFPMTALKVVKKDGNYDPEQLWTTTLKSRFSTPVLRDGKIYGFFGNGLITCVNAIDGQTLWADSTARGDYASVIDAGSILFFLTVKGDLIAVKPNAEKYEELAKYKLTENEAYAHPLFRGKNIFLRDKENEVLLSLE